MIIFANVACILGIAGFLFILGSAIRLVTIDMKRRKTDTR